MPFVVYADLKSFLKPNSTCLPIPAESYTQKIQKHCHRSFCYHIDCFDDSLLKQNPVTFTAEIGGDDEAQILVDTLERNIRDIYQQFKFAKNMVITRKKVQYNSATTCHICDGELEEDKVREHCHLTGRFSGAAHNGCNVNYKIPKFFPALFHNLPGYDGHLFIKQLKSAEDKGEKLKCIPNNEQKYISFSKEVIVDKFTRGVREILVERELRFIVSFRFLPSSLNALSKNLEDERSEELAKEYSGEKFMLTRKKGVYPWEYMD